MLSNLFPNGDLLNISPKILTYMCGNKYHKYHQNKKLTVYDDMGGRIN